MNKNNTNAEHEVYGTLVLFSGLQNIMSTTQITSAVRLNVA